MGRCQVLHVGSLCRRSAHQVLSSTSVRLSSSIVNTMTVSDIDIGKHAGELSTDEVDKIETVLNISYQFKIPAHMLNRNSAHEKHHSLRCHGQRVVQQREDLDK